MTTENYFKTELQVHFTRAELSVIMHALAELSFNEDDAHHPCNSENAWLVRDKVEKFATFYDKSAVL